MAICVPCREDLHGQCRKRVDLKWNRKGQDSGGRQTECLCHICRGKGGE